MAAGITDKFTETTNGTRPVPTTLTALLGSGSSPGTATCGALTGWATATAVHFIIYTIDVNGRKVAGSQTDWKGIVSGNTITSLALKAGTNNGYSIGAVVECAPTAAWADDVTEGIRVEHNQDGTHAAITATSLVASGNSTATSHISTGDAQLRSISLETIHSHFVFDFVQSGCVWSGDSYASTRAASMTAGVVYLSGRRVPVALVTARLFTASKDTYIDVDNTGTITYTEVTNNAASPALTAGSIRIGIIVTGASNIAAAGSVNQGEIDKILPIASSVAYSVTDSLGNLICPRDPNRKVLGYRMLGSSFVTSSSGNVAITGLSMPIIAPAGRKIRIRTSFYAIQTNAGAPHVGANNVWDGTVGTTQIDGKGLYIAVNGNDVPLTPNDAVVQIPAGGAKTYNASINVGATNQKTISANLTTLPTFIIAELV